MGRLPQNVGPILVFLPTVYTVMEAHTGKRLDLSHLVELNLQCLELDPLGVCS